MSAKQHELLAFANDITNKANTMLRETEHVFDRSSSFDEFAKTYSPFIEGDKDIPETEKKLMTTTVRERLNYTTKSLIKAVDILATKEQTNTVAKADIVILDEDGGIVSTLAEAVPVSALLQMEKQFQEYRKMYSKMPTFNTETSWIIGVNAKGEECYVEKDEKETIRTRSEIITESFNPNPIPGSEKYKMEPKDKKVNSPVGKYKTVTKTGRMSPKDKADILDRLDQVIRAVKAARAKANSIDVVDMNIAKDIFSFINNG